MLHTEEKYVEIIIAQRLECGVCVCNLCALKDLDSRQWMYSANPGKVIK